jgi:hypothetical protein
MVKFEENKKTELGYYSIVHSIRLGHHLEVLVDDSDTEKTPGMSILRQQSLCGYVSGIYIKQGKPNNAVIDLSPANPIMLLKEDCSKERTEGIFTIETHHIKYYRRIEPAP